MTICLSSHLAPRPSSHVCACKSLRTECLGVENVEDTSPHIVDWDALDAGRTALFPARPQRERRYRKRTYFAIR